ncbi:unnamed protein product [Clonostachys solani]|uniref:Uncharacterized protein n=1 Tax=Clonostachys solani TaxID=160281 RepID=A0A9N9ZNV7_9HYPO|nr:unnamed protein product [Clonostachys solani]
MRENVLILEVRQFYDAYATSPHLRGNVKALDINVMIEGSLCRCCVRYMSERMTRDLEAILNSQESENGLAFRADQLRTWNMDETIVQFMLALFPGLKSLTLHIPRHWRFGALSTWYDNQEGPTPRRLLESLCSAKFTLEKLENDTCTPDHQDCNHPAPESPVELFLTTAASSTLETLHCTAGALYLLPELPRLQELCLEMRGSWSKLNPLLTKAPALLRFSYLSTNEHAPLPREVEIALEPHKATLEVLQIDFYWNIISSPFDEFPDWKPPTDGQYQITSLRSFSNLKYVTLEAEHIWNFNSTETESPSERNLSDFLPESLELLCIDFEQFDEEERILSLARSIAEGGHANLRTVLWYGTEEWECMSMDRKDDAHWLENDFWREPLPYDLYDGKSERFPDWLEIMDQPNTDPPFPPGFKR